VHEIAYHWVGETDLAATLYVPDGPGPFPSVVNVHGGTWIGGNRFTNEPTARYLADHRIAVLSIDFRMPPAARYPECIADINASIRWLKRNAGLARTRPEVVGGIGFSSGGHQLMLAALRPDDSRYSSHRVADHAGNDARLAFVVLCWAVLDPLARDRMAAHEGKQELLNGHDAYWASDAEMDEGSPQRILERGEPADLPPVLVLQGDADANLGPHMATRFGEAYRRRGGNATVATFPGASHGFIRAHPNGPAAKAASHRIVKFIHERAQASLDAVSP
jgi:acetyl esterase/lipase